MKHSNVDLAAARREAQLAREFREQQQRAKRWPLDELDLNPRTPAEWIVFGLCVLFTGACLGAIAVFAPGAL